MSGSDTGSARLVAAAGVVVWRRGEGGHVEVLLVHRPRYDDWSLPKGKLDPGEEWHDAARREIEEETGALVELGRELTAVAYQAPAGPKVVRFWEAELTGGGSDPAQAWEANHEVDELRWATIDGASALSDRPTDRAVLLSFVRTLSGDGGGSR